MKQEVFEAALSKLNHFIHQCQKQQDKLDEVGGFPNLSVKELNEMITTSKNLKIRMDQFLNGELYHFIGMGNLNAVQIQTFNAAVKKLCSYRYLIEKFSLMSVVGFNPDTVRSYKCKLLMVSLQSDGEAVTVKGPSGSDN